MPCRSGDLLHLSFLSARGGGVRGNCSKCFGPKTPVWRISRRVLRTPTLGAVGRFGPPPIFGFKSGFDGCFDRDGQVAFKAESCLRYRKRGAGRPWRVLSRSPGEGEDDCAPARFDRSGWAGIRLGEVGVVAGLPRPGADLFECFAKERY